MASEEERQLQRMKGRLQDLADRSWRQNQYTFSGFLSMAEQSILLESKPKLPVDMMLWGGAEGAERRVARFGSERELGYEQDFPIVCLQITPLAEKFAEPFTHRDVLGAVLHLGIDRSMVGDIYPEGKEGWMFCLEPVASFIVGQLEQIRHTRVKCEIADIPEALAHREPMRRQINVAGLRCDNLVAEVWRSQSLELFAQKRVFIDGRQQENNSRPLKEGEMVTVRGFGRFIYCKECYRTKKGRLAVEVAVF